MICIKTEIKSIEPYIEYIGSIFNSIYQINSDIIVNYGFDKAGDVNVIPFSAIDFFSRTDPVPHIYSFIEWSGKKIPILFQENFNEPIIQFDELQKKVNITIDIISSAFYFLSCWQEHHSQKKDFLGRFPVKESLLYKLNILDFPVVNYYFEILVEAISKLNNIEISFKNHFSTIITHDIDKCRSGWKENTFHLIKAGKVVKAAKVIFYKMFFRDIWFNFDEILKTESLFNISSTYFFMATNKKFKGYSNADYNIRNIKIQKILDKIESVNSEIGIHGSIGSGWQKGRLKDEIQLLKRTVFGNRFHFLSIKLPKSFEIVEMAGLKYDSSLGFSERIGFRAGICTPYYPFNFNTKKSFSFIEFPLMVMDTTLIHKKYMGLDVNDSFNAVLNIINEVQKFQGTFVLLWHNTLFSGYKYQAWRDLYENILNELKNRNSLFYNFSSFINTTKK